MTRREKAIEYFKMGYNCSQSVALAFKDVLDIDEKTLLRLSSSFGGGMGRMRETCGAVSGMLMVAGLLYGYDDPTSPELKNAHYAGVQEVARAFEDRHGSLVCRELLGLKVKHDTPEATPRTDDFYHKRPCIEIIGTAADIMERYIAEHEALH